MTTTAADKFTESSQFGSGASWSGVSNLEDGNSGEASVTYSLVGAYPRTIGLYEPGFMSSLPNGCEFESLRVTFQKKASTSFGWSWVARLTGGDTKSGSYTTSYATVALEGDKDYWGLSGTPQAIFAGLKDGSIGLELDAGGSTSATLYYRSVYATLTYTLPDTKRASILTRCL